MTAKRTSLYQKHLTLGAKLVPFAGWEMPVSYPAGIIAEHNAVRSSVGIFDIGHMGLIKIKNKKSKIKNVELLNFIQRVTTNDASKLEINQCQYSIICNERGGVVDDILVYRLPAAAGLPDYYLIVANASNTEKVLSWLGKGTLFDDHCMLSIQGPKSEEIVSRTLAVSLNNLKRNYVLWQDETIISRTGYTGEDGFELIVEKTEAEKIWDLFTKAGVQPCGLGARDTLRLEAGLPLYGHEYDDDTTPLEAGYGWAVKFDKGDFIGRSALLSQKEKGLTKKLMGIEINDRAVPRSGCQVFDAGGENLIGKVTSGTFSPTFKKPIALAYLKSQSAVLGQEVLVEIREKKIPGKVVSKTFYQGGMKT